MWGRIFILGMAHDIFLATLEENEIILGGHGPP